MSTIDHVQRWIAQIDLSLDESKHRRRTKEIFDNVSEDIAAATIGDLIKESQGLARIASERSRAGQSTKVLTRALERATGDLHQAVCAALAQSQAAA